MSHILAAKRIKQADTAAVMERTVVGTMPINTIGPTKHPTPTTSSCSDSCASLSIPAGRIVSICANLMERVYATPTLFCICT